MLLLLIQEEQAIKKVRVLMETSTILKETHKLLKLLNTPLIINNYKNLIKGHRVYLNLILSLTIILEINKTLLDQWVQIVLRELLIIIQLPQVLRVQQKLNRLDLNNLTKLTIQFKIRDR